MFQNASLINNLLIYILEKIHHGDKITFTSLIMNPLRLNKISLIQCLFSNNYKWFSI